MAGVTLDQLNAAIDASPQLTALRQAMLAQFWHAPKGGAGWKDGGKAMQAYADALKQQFGLDWGAMKLEPNPINKGYLGSTAGGATSAALNVGGALFGAYAAPYLFGSQAAGTGGSEVAGSTIGPSTAANMAATEAASVAPEGIAAVAPVAATVGTGAIAPVLTHNVGSSALGWASLAGQIATPIIGGIFSDKANTNAQEIATEGQLKAAQIQADSTKQALDFAKQGYVTQQEQLAPYVGTGGAAMTKLSQLSGLGTPKPYVPPPSLQNIGAVAPGGSTGALAPTAGTSASQASQNVTSAGLVTLRAPNGDTAQKPASEAQHWISLGAQVVPSQAGA